MTTAIVSEGSTSNEKDSLVNVSKENLTIFTNIYINITVLNVDKTNFKSNFIIKIRTSAQSLFISNIFVLSLILQKQFI